MLRRYVRQEWLRREPDLAEHEARTLRLLGRTPVPAPRLVCADTTGARTDAPAVLMSEVGGSPREFPHSKHEFVRSLAMALVEVHAVPLPEAAAIRRYRPHNLHLHLDVPAWAARATVWEQAIEVYRGPIPRGHAGLIHRDFHPGNVLWSAGRVTGIVDWANASSGCGDADLGHCRMALALSSGQEWADRFLRAYDALSDGRICDYDPYWDIAPAVGALPDLPLSRTQAARLDDFVTRAIRRLTFGAP